MANAVNHFSSKSICIKLRHSHQLTHIHCRERGKYYCEAAGNLVGLSNITQSRSGNDMLHLISASRKTCKSDLIFPLLKVSNYVRSCLPCIQLLADNWAHEHISPLSHCKLHSKFLLLLPPDICDTSAATHPPVDQLLALYHIIVLNNYLL